MWISDKWKDFALLDASDGERLEMWGRHILIRPDPQVVWKNTRRHNMWGRAAGKYKRPSAGKGAWAKNDLPESWTVSYKQLKFKVKPMGFKHMGLFPEQAANWDWFSSLIKAASAEKELNELNNTNKSKSEIKVLNLFAYTGGATVAAAFAGASVCHLDASRGMVNIARENAALSGLSDAPIRYIVDDCKKFLQREVRRGNRYDAIIMDPPSYGKGPTGETFKIENNIDELVSLAVSLLSDTPLFFLLNSYTTGLSPLTMHYLLHERICASFKHFDCRIEAGELALPVKASGQYLPCGASVRCTFKM